MKPEAIFLAADAGFIGRRFCLYHPARSRTTHGLVLYVHPFAEEMNKSRRMAALQSQALARAGYGVLQIDLLGCGDSSGDFSDATWSAWVNDVVLACRWLQQRARTPLWMWGLRAGCLLAAEAARQVDAPCNFMFWQPPASGKVVLQQFLRLKLAADMLAGQSAGAMDSLRSQLSAGAPVEIAGYALAPALASGLERATLRPPKAGVATERVEWFELSGRADADLAPASRQTMQRWQEAGYAARSRSIVGPAFWQTTEIEECRLLLSATTTAISEAVIA